MHRVRERAAVRTASAAQLALALEPVRVLQSHQRQVSDSFMMSRPRTYALIIYNVNPLYVEIYWCSSSCIIL